ncbi:MAG: hypothetical protein WCL14_10185 [Bacteroidota bacterium]
MNLIGLLIILLPFIIIWQVIQFFNGLKEKEKTEKNRLEKLKAISEIERKDAINIRSRISLGIYLPETKQTFYPILLQPIFEEWNYLRNPMFRDFPNHHHDGFGASEKVFFHFLTEYFDRNLIANNALKIRVNGDYFTPDFTYIDKINNIYIDIEIDEPYIGNTKNAHHFITSDDLRNQKMRLGGWSVIRFSEKQIIEQPKECCKFIASYLAYASIDKNKLNGFEKIGDVIPDKTWTKEEAEQMAINRYRSSYLPKEFQYQSKKKKNNYQNYGPEKIPVVDKMATKAISERLDELTKSKCDDPALKENIGPIRKDKEIINYNEKTVKNNTNNLEKKSQFNSIIIRKTINKFDIATAYPSDLPAPKINNIFDSLKRTRTYFDQDMIYKYFLNLPK